MRSLTGKLKCLALILSLPSTSSNSVFVLSAQSSISEFSRCPNAFGDPRPSPQGRHYRTSLYHTAQLHTAPISANSENPLLARSLYVCLSLLSSGCCITSLLSHPSCSVHKQDSQKFWVHLTPLPPPVASHWHAAHALHSSVLSAYPRPRQQCTRTTDLP